ncbi:MAG: hypothetical protein FH762_05705 [Firmicutes bacterium]|nr:hypothetical protein [Bacillota bacterium]
MERKLKKIVLLLLIPILIFSLTACSRNYSTEEIRETIAKALYEDYGEEFVVDRIGIRRANKIKFYQARIYPKSIIGTPKEGDKYYYGKASIDILSYGKLSAVADNYGVIKMNEEIEKYLMPQIKKLFGERVLLKTDVKYKEKEESGYFTQYLEHNLKHKLKQVRLDPENKRLELELYVYIFDRIDSDEEKEERRKQIFDYVQYLKREGLFKYLSLIIEIVDEKALTPSYRKYKRELELSEKETVKINGIKVELPLKELIKEVSEVLGKELKEQNEQELIKNMSNIRQDELGINGIEGYLEQYFIRIISIDMMKVQPYGEYREEKEKGRIKEHRYLKREDIKFGKENPKYIFR